MGSIRKLINRLSVGQKVMTVIIVEVMSYTMVTTIALMQIHAVGTEVKQMSDLYLPLFSSTESIRQQIQEGRLNLREIIFVGDRVVYDKDAEETYIAARVRYQGGNGDITYQISWAENLIGQSVRQSTDGNSLIKQYSPRLLTQLSNIQQASRIHNKRAEKIFRHVEDGSFLMGMEMIDEMSASEAVLNRELDNLVSYLQELKKASVDYAINVEKMASIFTILASIITVCVVIAIFFYIVKRNISKPLHILTDAINSFNAMTEVRETESERDLMGRGDELGMVSRSLNKLKHDLWAQGHDLRAAKEEAEQANRAKSHFLAAASHDLRQPLHTMQMYIAALRHKLHDKDTLSIVADIDAVSISTGRLLNALLDVSQLEAGAVKPQFVDFPVQEVMRRVARAFKPLAYRKNLRLSVVPSSAFVRSDPVLLERIIGNFASNAMQYTDKGSVLLGCRLRGGQLAIEVWDTGPGIPSDQATAIFEDFHQLHNKERDRDKGLGLGLAIVRRLVACLGHRLEHDSKVGQGSRFAVLVDIAEKTAVANEEEEQFEQFLQDLRNIVVLLIEDDLPALNATQQLLNFWGCRVLPARSLDEALVKVSESAATPDIVVADYRLPGGLNGTDAITRVQLALGVAIPAIIITGEVQTEEIKEISELGYRVLFKPVRPAKLRALMTHLLLQRAAPPQPEGDVRWSA